LLLLGAISPSAAFAHRLNVTALVQGKNISGEAYYVDGSPARNAAVTALDPAGKTIGQATTDDQGRFSFPVRFRCDHRVVVEAGDGHAKTVTVSAKGIPGTVPAWDGVPSASSPDASAPPPTEMAADLTAQLAALQAQVAELRTLLVSQYIKGGPIQLAALEEQVGELRMEVARYENKVRLHDVLGGIGCILGLMGLAFYFLGVRRREKAECRNSDAEGTKE
jgi:nickel transport protein